MVMIKFEKLFIVITEYDNAKWKDLLTNLSQPLSNKRCYTNTSSKKFRVLEPN